MDEMNLLTLNAEECKKARTDYQNFVLKYFSYYHYRDKQKLYRKPCGFVYPVGKAYRDYMDAMYKRVRRYPVKPTFVSQSIPQTKEMYQGQPEETSNPPLLIEGGTS